MSRRIILPLSILGTGIGFTVIFKDSMSGPWYKGEEKLFGRTVIITGASSGLGKETAKNMSKRGGRIVMACRDMEKCEVVRKEIVEETFNKNIVCYELNLASLKSVRDFAQAVNQNEKRIDILINNAGIMGPSKRELTAEGFEGQLGVNYLGPFLLTHLLLDKLKASAPSRILNLTGSSLRQGEFNFKDLNCDNYYNMRKAHYQSKLALYNFGILLAEKLKGTSVTVYNVHPGMCLTEIGRNLGMNKSLISSTILHPLWWLLLKTPTQGIQTILHCALSPTDELSSGSLYEECMLNDILPEELHHRPHADRIWAISENWTRLKES